MSARQRGFAGYKRQQTINSRVLLLLWCGEEEGVMIRRGEKKEEKRI